MGYSVWWCEDQSEGALARGVLLGVLRIWFINVCELLLVVNIFYMGCARCVRRCARLRQILVTDALCCNATLFMNAPRDLTLSIDSRRN